MTPHPNPPPQGGRGRALLPFLKPSPFGKEHSSRMPRSIAAGAIAFIGFGEAALAFLDGWRTAPGFAARVSAYDVKTDSPDSTVRAGKRADYVAANVIGASTAPGAVAGADAIFSVVTADQAHEAAVAALPGVERGAFFFDCDSCAPQTKERTAKEVDAAGGRYVDVAVMAPVHPRLHRTPLLISGPHAKDAAPVLAALGMAADIHEGPVGSSSAIKMIRSIMMKGLEALVCECVLAGMKAGVIETDSLDDAYPGFDYAQAEETFGGRDERFLARARRPAEKAFRLGAGGVLGLAELG